MKTLGKVLWLFMLFLISQIYGILIGISMIPSENSGKPYDPSLPMELLITASAIFSVYLVWMLAKRIGLPMPNFKGWTWKDTGLVAGVFAATRLLAHIGTLLLEQANVAKSANDAAINDTFAHFTLPLVFIIAAICGPILEEWVFRAGIISYLFEKFPIIGVVISSIIFAAIHMPKDLASWIVYGGMGLIFSLVYYKTKRLELVMVMHILHNAASFWT